jgi:L-ascorbate metabolism protein UlaG (beta-lactamase superfamily)
MNGHPSTGKDNVPIARLAPLPRFELSPLDCVILSHLHSDHFDNVAREALAKNLLLIAPLNQKPKLESWGFQNIQGLTWWQEFVLTKDNETLKLISVPAQHSHDAQTNQELGVVSGYILKYSANGITYTIYWTGDTVWFDEMDEIKKAVGDLDLLIPHLGAVGMDGPWGLMTLNSNEAVKLVELMEPQAIAPIHHHTFSHYIEPVSLFQEKINNSEYKNRLFIFNEGEMFDFNQETWGTQNKISVASLLKGQIYVACYSHNLGDIATSPPDAWTRFPHSLPSLQLCMPT